MSTLCFDIESSAEIVSEPPFVMLVRASDSGIGSGVTVPVSVSECLVRKAIVADWATEVAVSVECNC